MKTDIGKSLESPSMAFTQGKEGGASVRTKRRGWALLALPVPLLLLAPHALAQEAISPPHPLNVKLADENNIDLMSANAHFAIPDASISDLSHVMTVAAYDLSTQGQPNSGYTPPERDNFIGGLGYVDNRDPPLNPSGNPGRASFQIRVAGISTSFFVNADYSLQSFDGSTLSGIGVNSWTTPGTTPNYPIVLNTNLGIWTLTARDGTKVDIDTGRKTTVGFTHYLGTATKITYPNGRIVRINYRSDCTTARVQSVTRNDGLMLKYTYVDSSCGAKLTGVIALNTAYQYCDPFADSCTVDSTWRRSQYGYTYVDGRSIYNVTDQHGVLSRFTLDKWLRVLSYKPPGNSEDLMTFQYCQSYNTTIIPGTTQQLVPTLSQSEPGKADSDEVYCGQFIPGPASSPPEWRHLYNRILRVTRLGQFWKYSLPALLGPAYSPYRRYTASRPVGLPGYVNIDSRPGGGLISYEDPSRALVYYTDPESQRIDHGQLRGASAETFSYDDRGNVETDGIISAHYSEDCANVVKCNQPEWVKDHAGNETDFTYDDVHGGVLTKTQPAVATLTDNSVRPQARYTYVQRYAWFLNSSGVMTKSAEPIWLLASESYCRTSAASTSGVGCSVTGDEVVTTYDYGPDTGPNNLWLRGTVVTADGQSLRTCYGYSKFGDKISETTPRAGLAVCQ